MSQELSGAVSGLSGRVLNLERQYLGLPTRTDFNDLSTYNSSTFNTITQVNNSQNSRINTIEEYIINLKLQMNSLTGYLNYVSEVGDGSSSYIEVTHSLGTENLHVTLRDTTSGASGLIYITQTNILDSNTVAFTFTGTAPTSGQYIATIST